MYSRTQVTQTLKGNEKQFKLAGVRGVDQTKLLSRLSHKVYRLCLLFSPVLLCKLTITKDEQEAALGRGNLKEVK